MNTTWTETWVQPGDNDNYSIRELCPKGYILHHVPRESGRGGGVGLLMKESLKAKKQHMRKFYSFEYMDVLAKPSNGIIRIITMYRPPPSKQNRLQSKTFFDDFSSLLEELVTTPGKLLIVGDLNFHLDESKDCEATKFSHLLDSFNLKQHVTTPTHNRGHILDVIITRSDDDLVDNVMVRDPTLSDHLAVHCNLKLKKPRAERKEIKYRKLNSIDMKSLHNHLKEYTQSQDTVNDLSSLVENYESELTRIMDIHAPVKTRKITLRPSAPWYDDKIDEEKRKRRKLERRWRKSRLVIDRQLYKDRCKVVNSLIKNAKQRYYLNLIGENKVNQRMVFNTVDKLFLRKIETCYPTAPSPERLANNFADFFCNKIEIIQNSLCKKKYNRFQLH